MVSGSDLLRINVLTAEMRLINLALMVALSCEAEYGLAAKPWSNAGAWFASACDDHPTYRIVPQIERRKSVSSFGAGESGERGGESSAHLVPKTGPPKAPPKHW